MARGQDRIRRFRAAAVIAACAAVMACATTPSGHAVGAVWSALDAAWNARDAARFSALYTEDASFEFVDRRQVIDGRAAIREHFTAQFARTPAAFSHHTRVRGIRHIGAGVVAVDGVVEVRRAASPFRSFAIFALMTADDDGWRIDTLRAYRLDADAGTAGSARSRGMHCGAQFARDHVHTSARPPSARSAGGR